MNRGCLVVAAALLGACTPPAPAPDAPAGSGVVEPPAATAPQGQVPPEPAPPEPAPEPPPPVVTAPDGTVALPCEDAPPHMSCIPGGPFVRGTNDGPENARPQDELWVQTFYMDVYEVTYAQYKACEKAKECPRGGPRYLGYDYPNMPVTGVSWFESAAYCEAMGKQLPSEAQWEKAARGTKGATYSWGNEPINCERAIYKNEDGRSCGLKKDKSKPETGRPWDVGSRPVGIYGLYDMIGNSWEWVDDWYARSYETCGEDCRGVDPRGPCGGGPDACPGHGRKIVRGGSWYWPADHNTGVFRRAHVPKNDPFHHFGFRCAATADQARALSSSPPDAGKAE